MSATRAPQARKLYEPKAYQVGDWVDFAEHREGDGEIIVRRGQVWSSGPPGEGRTLWVVPDDGGVAVVVKIRQRPMLTDRTLLDVISGHKDYRPTMRIVENLRKFNQLFPVVIKAREEYVRAYEKKMVEYLCWHVNPDCSEAVGKPAPSRNVVSRFNVPELIRELLAGRVNISTSRHCHRCFWLIPSDE